MKSIYNYSNSRSDVYEIYGDTRIQSNSSTIFVDSNISSWTVRPYARKIDNIKIAPIREWKIQTLLLNTTKFPDCHNNFFVPAILFDGSFAGNYFQVFADVQFPLYVTTSQFNRCVLFLVSNSHSWLARYNLILEKFTKYDIMDIDKENRVLCFSKVIVGLKADKEMGINSLVSPNHSIKDFRQFLRSTYSLERETMNNCCSTKQPRVLKISRKNNRRLRNEEEVAKMARKLGADISLEEMESNMSMSVTASLVNSFDVLIGVHGAGLTNMVFLPDNAVLIQITPFGLDVYSHGFYGEPTRGLNLRYLEYMASLSESSLVGKYPPNSEVYTNPHAIHRKGIALYSKIYMINQDVIVDLDRFRTTLLNALNIVLHIRF